MNHKSQALILLDKKASVLLLVLKVWVVQWKQM